MSAEGMDASLVCDYLVVGAGGAGLAFVDTLLEEPGIEILLVDRRTQVGGHWNDAYPFVRLHQPTPWYGVASRAVPDETDALGRGARGATVQRYFETLLEERLLASGRVRWLPAHEHARVDGAHTLTAPDGERRTVHVRRRFVDATQARTEVSTMRPPPFAVAEGVACTPPHTLRDHVGHHRHFTVVGAGKTAMDSLLWLMDEGIEASAIRWIVPRDPWLLDRDFMRTGLEHFERSMGGFIGQLSAIAESSSIRALWQELERRGIMVRLDPAVEPTSYRCANVSRAELERLRTVRDVVRLGHLERVTPASVVLERGTLDARPETLYVDCTARGLQQPLARRVFDGDTINLLYITWCRPLFSAAMIAAIERFGKHDAERNAMSAAVPLPERPKDLPRMWAISLANAAAWHRNDDVQRWMHGCRLSFVSMLLDGASMADPTVAARVSPLLRANNAAAQAAALRIPALLASPD